MLEHGEKQKERKTYQIKLMEEEEKQLCTFNPKLDNKRIARYLKNPSRSVKNIHNSLFEERKEKESKLTAAREQAFA